MVKHPTKFPWSSYHYNGLGKANGIVTPRRLYLRPGKTQKDRQKVYRELLKGHISEQVLTEIRESTNKAWVLGSSRFKEQIERKLNRRVAPLPRGGDRKSEAYRDSI